jgi:exonuclease III
MKIASLNVERSMHMQERVLPFLKREQPDIFCVQELCPHDIPALEDLFGQKVLYAPMNLHGFPTADDARLEPVGVGLVAKTPLLDTAIYTYAGQPLPLAPQHMMKVGGHFFSDISKIGQLALSATVAGMRVMTTHLAVTVKGESTPEQQALAKKLIDYATWEANRFGGLLLCGDFNAPRGRRTWEMLCEAFTDNIPPAITSTIDGNIHRAGPIPYVVDGLFTTGHARVNDVQMHNGLSDHCGFTAMLTKA